MNNLITFASVQDFTEFEAQNQKTGTLFPDAKYDRPHDISMSEMLKLTWLILDFEPYRSTALAFKLSPNTNEIFIGSVNEGGHVTRARIIRINRKHILSNPGKLIKWSEDYDRSIWTA